MTDDACRSKRADVTPEKRKPVRAADSRATVGKDGAPSTFQTLGREPTVTFSDASGSVVRGGPIVADLPAWALQQHSDPKLRDEIASPVAGQSRYSSSPFAPLMTIGEAATILHVSPRTIRRIVDDYVPKPFSPRQLLAKIRQYLS